jgi:hypothetical protein
VHLLRNVLTQAHDALRNVPAARAAYSATCLSVTCEVHLLRDVLTQAHDALHNGPAAEQHEVAHEVH